MQTTRRVPRAGLKRKQQERKNKLRFFAGRRGEDVRCIPCFPQPAARCRTPRLGSRLRGRHRLDLQRFRRLHLQCFAEARGRFAASEQLPLPTSHLRLPGSWGAPAPRLPRTARGARLRKSENYNRATCL